MSVDLRELRRLQHSVRKKAALLNVLVDYNKFDYEKPEMAYDKDTGDITLVDKAVKKKKRIVKNLDDLTKEKQALYSELGLDSEGKPMDGETEEGLAEKLLKIKQTMLEDLEIDPTQFYIFSRDFLRIDIGLVIQRPPIFMHMSERDAEFLKLRNNYMNEYFFDQRQYTEQWDEVSKLNEDILSDNVYSSPMNLDNFPTHRYTDPVTGKTKEYAGASKHHLKVDPNMEDVHSLHYASEYRTFLLLKNRYTGEWEFPASRIFFGETMMRAKQNLFMQFSKNNWRLKY